MPGMSQLDTTDISESKFRKHGQAMLPNAAYKIPKPLDLKSFM